MQYAVLKKSLKIKVKQGQHVNRCRMNYPSQEVKQKLVFTCRTSMMSVNHSVSSTMFGLCFMKFFPNKI